MKNLLFTFQLLSYLLIGSNSYSQCSVNAGLDQSIECQANVQLFADVPTWSDKNSNISANIMSMRFVGDTIIAVGSNCAYRSTNYGTSWTATNIYYNDNRSLVINSQNHLYAAGYYYSGNNGRIMRSTDNGISWTLLVDHGSREYWDMTIYSDTVYATGVNRSNWTGRLDVTYGGTTFGQVSSFSTTAWVTPYAIAVSPSTIVIGTGNGINGGFKVSTDRGFNWVSIDTTVNGGTFSNVNDIQFVNDTIAYAACNNGVILKTTDAGLSWSNVFSSGYSDPLKTVAFKDLNNGIAAGGSGNIFKTTDGGANWTNVSTGTSAIIAAVIKNYSTYLLTGNFHLLKEKTYTYLWSNASTLSNANIQNPIANVTQTTTYTVSATDENLCVATDNVVINVNPMEMKVFNSQNILSGQSVQLYVDADTNSNQVVDFQWSPNTNINSTTSISPIVTPSQTTTYHINAVINGVQCASDSVLITVVEPSVDAGADKTIQYGGSISFYDASFDPILPMLFPESNSHWTNLKFFSEHLGYISRRLTTNVYKTYNSGTSFMEILKTGSNVSCMKFADSLKGAVGTIDGDLYYTTNGGQSWSLSTPTTEQINGIFFTPSYTYIVCNGGIMKKSSNGGQSWTSVSIGASSDLLTVQFLNDTIGFVGVYSNTGCYIKKTVDQGNTWTTQGGAFPFIYDMHFIDENNGFVAAYSEAKRTTNGGQTWSDIVVDGGLITGNLTLLSIDFINDTVGYMGSPFIKTTDGGANWTKINTLNPPSYDISAVDEHIIFGMGNNNYVRYLNPQYTWTPATNLDNPTILKPTFTPGLTTNYTLSVTLNNTYTATDAVLVTVPDPCISQLNFVVNSTNNSVAFTTLLNQAPYTSPFNYNWQFGDGTQSTQANPVHSYSGPGYQNVNFTATSFNGCTIDTSFVVEIGNAGAMDCQANFAYTIDHSTKSITVNNFSMGNNITDYVYYFGDGQYAYNANSTHTYTSAGNYNVCLTVYSSTTGCSNTKCKTMVVDTAGFKCKAHFVYTLDSASKKVSFYNTSNNNSLNDWTFGDNGQSTLESPTHTYATDGHYLGRLIVQNNGCKDMYQEIVNVNTTAASLYSDFGYLFDNVISKSGGFPVQFYAASAGVPAKYLWDFGDGTQDSLTNQPMHEYANAGQYNVCLTVSDPAAGLSYNVCRSITITAINTMEENAIFELFPNPANQSITLKMGDRSGHAFEVKIVNSLGMEVYETIMQKERLQIDLSGFESGIYYVILQNEDERSIRKLLITK